MFIRTTEARSPGESGTVHGSSTNGAEGLEQIFLKLTGENAAREFVDVLDA